MAILQGLSSQTRPVVNTEDSVETRSIKGAQRIGVTTTDTTALFQRLGVAVTTAKAAVGDDRTAGTPVPNIALRRMSRQLAASMTKLVDEFSSLLNQLANAEATHSLIHQGAVPMTLEAEQLRQQLVWGGYRLASELRKVARAQQLLASPPKLFAVGNRSSQKQTVRSAAVIDIQDILKSIRGKLQEAR